VVRSAHERRRQSHLDVPTIFPIPVLRTFHKWLQWLPLTGMALLWPAVALWLGLSATRTGIDDAYITFRYSSNIAAGFGFVYNPGERVLGTSTPLYTLLLAAACRLGANPVVVSGIAGALAWSAIAALGILHVRSLGLLPLLALGLIASSPTIAANLAMESALYCALVLSAFYCFEIGRKIIWAVLAGLAAVTRPDGLIAAATLGVAALLRDRKLPWRQALTTALVIVPWYAYAWFNFGSPLPQSFRAKAGLAHSAGFGGGDFLVGLVRLAAQGLSVSRTSLLWGVLWAAGLLSWAKKRHKWPLLTWAALYSAAYWATGMPHFGWYYLPLVPLGAILCAEGAGVVSRLPRNRWIRRVLVVGLALALSLDLGARFEVCLRIGKNEPPRAKAYREVGLWLAQHAERSDSIALLEIGIVGYHSGLHVIDTMGLVTPYMGARLLDWGQSLALALNRFWPDYALAVSNTAWEAIERQDWFRSTYRPVLKVDHRDEGDPAAALTLYERLPGHPARVHTQWPVGQELLPGVQLAQAGVRGLPVVTRGAPMHVLLHWLAHEPQRADARVAISLQDQSAGQVWPLIADRRPLNAGLPTFLWLPGEKLQDYCLLLAPQQLPQGRYRLMISLGNGAVGAGTLWVDPQPAEVLGSAASSVLLSNGALVLGWVMHQEIARRGQEIDLSVLWSAAEPIAEDWHVFVHLVAEQEQLLSQWDGPPARGFRPTSTWQPSEVIADTYTLAVPQDLPPGEYRVLFGLYDWRTHARATPLQPPGTGSGAIVAGHIRID
jgi:hypothetical protein